MKKLLLSAATLLAALTITPITHATTISTNADRDTYVSSGEPTVNFGSKGAMMIAAPTASQNRTEEAIFSYNTSSIKSSLDAEYGTNGWIITSITLTLYSNYPTAGNTPGNSSFNTIAAGNFELSWLSNDTWSETGINWNNITNYLPATSESNLMESLGTFTFLGDGTTALTWSLTLSSGLVADVLAGDEVTIFGTPADSSVGYLFNTSNNSVSHMTVTAVAAPEPSTYALLLGGMFTMWMMVSRKKKSSLDS